MIPAIGGGSLPPPLLRGSGPDPGREPVTGQGGPRDSSGEAVDRPLVQTARSRLDTSGSLRVTVLIESMTEERQVLLAADLLDILGKAQGAPGSRGQLSALGSDDHD